MNRFNTTSLMLVLSSVLALAVACNPVEPGEGEGEAECGADEWCAPDFETNAAEALDLRARLDTLTGDATMRGVETGAVTITGAADLTTAFNAGDPSLADVASAGFTPKATALFTEFAELANVGPLDLVDANGDWAAGDEGGIFGDEDRGINEGGLEVRQLVDKAGLTGGVMYAYALSLTEGDVDSATVELIAAAWGADANLDPEVVTDAANYSHSMGYYGPIAAALTAAHIAADAGDQAALDTALVSFFRLWEESMYARVFYYANAAAELVAVDTGDNTVAEAIHKLSEGIGLALGFHGLPHSGYGPLAGAGRVVEDDTIESMMTALGVDVTFFGAATTGELIVDPTAFAAAVAEVEADVRSALGAADAEIEEWKVPTAG